MSVLLNHLTGQDNTVPALMWCILELNLSIIGGCIPAAKPFLQKLFPAILGSSRGQSTNGGVNLQSLQNCTTSSGKSGAIGKPRRFEHSGSEERFFRINDEG
jgi:hypothetical protein